MKRVKLAIMAAAILLSIGGAFATKIHQDCRYAQQYVYTGSGYMPITGELGTTYYCVDVPGTCTYNLVAAGYAACQAGGYQPINHAIKSSK
jgi:hypothetical protein